MRKTHPTAKAVIGPYRTLFILILIVIFCVSVCTCLSCVGKKEELAPVLMVLNWDNYIDMGVVKSFKKEFGVTVIFDDFESESEMIALIQSNPGVYDLAVASTSIIDTMISLDLLATIDVENIPNRELIDPLFLSRSDDSNTVYSIPYLWGTSGIAVNRRYVTEKEIDWNILFDPRYQSRIDMLNDIQEDFSPALKVLGYSINSRDEKELAQAESLLKSQRTIIRGYFSPSEAQDHLIDGSSIVVYLYSGDSLGAAEKNPDIEYVVPESGAPVWVDHWVIPASSPNRYTAEVFINYILEPHNIAKISNYVWYANVISDSKQYLSKELLNSRSIYLAPDILEKCEYYIPLDEKTNRYFNRVWYDLLR